MKTVSTMSNKRFGLVLLFSLALHIMVLVLLGNRETTEIALPAQAGSSFSITLQEIRVVDKPPKVKAKPSTQKKPEAFKHKPVAAEEPMVESHHEQVQNNNTQTSAVSNTLDNAQVISVINKEFKKFFYYPPLAIKRNWQGRVVLNFKISPAGEFENINILESSGYEILDLAAVSALNKMKRVASLMKWPGNGVDVNLPIIYQLKKG